LIILCLNAFAQNDEPKIIDNPKETEKLKKSDLDVEDKIHKTRFYVAGDYMTIAPVAGSAALSGPGGTFQFVYAFNEKWGSGLELRQSFDTAGNTLLTTFSGRLTRALTGKLNKTERKIKLADLGVGQIQESNMGGWRFQGIITQYYFNGSLNTVPYAGMGISVFYEFPSVTELNYFTGFRYDRIGNAGKFVTPMSIFFGVSFWY
jgi:hypothetical protein